MTTLTDVARRQAEPELDLHSIFNQRPGVVQKEVPVVLRYIAMLSHFAKKGELMAEVAVFYLARFKEGFSHFAEFAQSLRDHPAGSEHDLIIICKGFSRRSEYAVLSGIFKGIPHQITDVDEDVGQDIQSYQEAASRFPHTYCCFINTFTQIRTDNWLKKLHDAMLLPQVGMAGATASLESLNNSYELLHTVGWLANAPTRYDRSLYQSFYWVIASSVGANAERLRAHYRGFRGARRWVGDAVFNRPLIAEVLHQPRKEWAKASAEGGPFHFAAKYPHFPNPHIRSNVFMARREDLLQVKLSGGDKKLACCSFESGADGLSSRILRRGERLVVVGADGRAYDIPDWPNSGCFRSGQQENLLAVDNQTKAFDRYSPPEREILRTMAWGSYLQGAPSVVYGVPFDSVRPLASFIAPKPARRLDRYFSIVIPTHNRLELTLDAIKTVQEQDYQNWEICVFDNASAESVKDAIAGLNDDRIRCERSDEFLPVTQSWNRALNMARGDYVTLIGDDDGLAPGFFKRIAQLADQFEEPDAIFSALFQFFHPGVLPDKPLGILQTLPTAAFMAHRDYPFLLDKASARKAVDGSLSMRRSFMFNMPALTVRKEFLESLRRDGDILHPPFPDYYFANLVFDKADKLVVEPRPIAFQGVSTSSFGFTLFNQKTDEGFKVLGHKLSHDRLFPDVGHHLLPGPGYNSQYIMTMAHLAKAINEADRQPDFIRYRRLQIYHYVVSRGFPNAWGKTEEVKELWEKMSLAEKADAYYMAALNRLARRYRQFKRPSDALADRLKMHAFTPMQHVLNEGDFLKGSEVFEAFRKDENDADGNR